MELKRYQARTLSAVSEFLRRAKYMGAAEAFAAVRNAPGYRARYVPLPELPRVPYVCVRVPTGGGKTFMAAHLPGLSADFMEREKPCVLWLVPTEIIRAQTLSTLRDPDHPNARALADAFGGEVRVFDITEAADLRRQDMEGKACVFVATFASLRVTNTAGRRVYAHHENFEPHFSRVPEAARAAMERDERGEVKFSFANLLSFLHPLVLVDEAHNNKSKLSAETLARFSPSLVIEFTATPAGNSNVLYKVSASELKEEGMIKLPIRLEERPSAEETIAAAVGRRAALEEAAVTASRYIRPIVLFQAEAKGHEWTAERLRNHLLSEEHIPAEEIAVATGTQKELAGIDLFDRACHVRFIITVEALREGWDCSFAYVLCSLARVSSSTAAEQFLGRVMRMPYVSRQEEAALNKAYAFVNGSAWTDSVAGIRDQLVSMGFDDAEARENLEYDPYTAPQLSAPQRISFVVSEEPEQFESHFALHEGEVSRQENGNFLVSVTLHDEETAREIAAYAESTFKKPENVAAVREAVSHVPPAPVLPAAEKTPSERGVKFPVPQLCLFAEGETVTVEEDAFLPDGFDLSRVSPALTNFFYDEASRSVELDIRGTREGGVRVSERQADPYGAALFSSDWTEAELLVWLSQHVRESDVSYQAMNAYLLRVVDVLRLERKMPLGDLVRFRYQLAEAVRETLARAREAMTRRNFQELLFTEAGSKRLLLANPMVFAKSYPVKNCYQGNYSFRKHFFPLIGEMNPEEEEAAKILDRSAKVDFWIRNLERQPLTSFWLQTSTDKFYPDFVAKLTDGRVFVLEHKGMDRVSNDDSREKRALGNLWASLSKGEGIFLMSCLVDEKGRSLAQQIEEAIK